MALSTRDHMREKRNGLCAECQTPTLRRGCPACGCTEAVRPQAKHKPPKTKPKKHPRPKPKPKPKKTRALDELLASSQLNLGELIDAIAKEPEAYGGGRDAAVLLKEATAAFRTISKEIEKHGAITGAVENAIRVKRGKGKILSAADHFGHSA